MSKKFDKYLTGLGVDPNDIDTKRMTQKLERPNGKFMVFKSVSIQCDIIYAK